MTKFKSIILGILVFVAELSICVVLWRAYTNVNFRHFLNVSTSILPERFTELYFEDHTKLPVAPDINGNINFNFVIHNLESEDMNYEYLISSTDILGDQRLIKNEKIFIKNDGINVIDAQIDNIDDSRSKIVVELLNRNQHISFWIGKK